MASRDLPWAFHNVYPSLDVQNVPGYPNHCPTEWRENCPKFDGDPALAVTHVANYMKYVSSLDVLHEDVLMKIFVSSLESSQKDWLAHLCDPKSIPSSTKLIEEFLRHYRPATQSLEDAFQELKHILCREGFPINDETIDEEVLEEHTHENKLEEDPDEENLDETFDEEEVLISTLPFDEDIQAFVPPAHQEENMISDNPFEDLDDALFCDFGSEELLEEPLDATDLSKKGHMKHSALRIKPRVMKRRWRSMPMKRKNNLDEAQHVEASFSLLLLDEDEVVQTCLPPAHEDEETISLDDTDDLVQDPSDMVDLHIDDFIQVGRRRWDVSCFSIDRDPIYDIEGSSQAEGVEFSSSEEWSSYVYDSDVWQPGDDMVTDLFFPFEDDLSQHTQSDLQSSFGAYPFEDADLFYEDFQPLCSYFEEYQDVATSEQSEVHSSKRKYFHLGYFHGDSQGKRRCFSTPETVPYLLPSSPRDHAVFF
jgi:hypothetical protein